MDQGAGGVLEKENVVKRFIKNKLVASSAQIFLISRWLEEKTHGERIVGLIEIGISALLSHWAYEYLVHSSLWPSLSTSLFSVNSENYYVVLIHLSITFPVWVILHYIYLYLVSIFYYSPVSIPLRFLGLVEAANDEDASYRLQQKYRGRHPAEKKIRVICISGRELFAVNKTETGRVIPLHVQAAAGNLDVVMPVSDPGNITVSKRFKGYSPEQLAKLRYENCDDLVKEIVKGKNFLGENVNNVVTEHSLLCMWRVVLFENHCLIQNYFPNNVGPSSLAPVLVFEKTESGSDYYSVFEEMFMAVKG